MPGAPATPPPSDPLSQMMEQLRTMLNGGQGQLQAPQQSPQAQQPDGLAQMLQRILGQLNGGSGF